MLCNEFSNKCWGSNRLLPLAYEPSSTASCLPAYFYFPWIQQLEKSIPWPWPSLPLLFSGCIFFFCSFTFVNAEFCSTENLLWQVLPSLNYWKYFKLDHKFLTIFLTSSLLQISPLDAIVKTLNAPVKDWEQLGQNHKALNGSISKMVYSLGAVVACQNNRNSEGKFIKNYPF